MRLYLPASNRSVLFENKDGIIIWSVLDLKGQSVNPELLEPHELIAVGRAIELHRQLQHGLLEEVDEYILAPWDKK